MLGSIIGGIGSLIGGLFGSSEKDKDRDAAARENQLQREFNARQARMAWKRSTRSVGLNLKNTILMARRMGISPLAVLGGGSHGTPVQPAQAQSLPGPQYPSGLGDGIGQAIASVGDALTAAQVGLVKEQTRSIMRNDALAARDMIDRARSRSLISAQHAAGRGGAVSTISPKDMVRPSLNVVPPQGTKWPTGASTNAQDFENEYGDLASSAYGLWRLGSDIWDDFARKNPWFWNTPRYKRMLDAAQQGGGTTGNPMGDAGSLGGN